MAFALTYFIKVLNFKNRIQFKSISDLYIIIFIGTNIIIISYSYILFFKFTLVTTHILQDRV